MLKARLYRDKNSKAQPVEPRLEGEVLVVDDNFGLFVDDLTLQVSGEDGQRISVRSAKTGAVLLFDSAEILDVLAESGNSTLAAQAETAARKLSGKKGSDFRYWSIVFSSIIGTFIVGYLAFNAFIAWVPSHVDKKMERYIGEAASSGVVIEKNKEEQARVKRVGEALIAHSGDLPYKFVFHVKKDPQINACAYPGGFMYVNSGLLKAVKSDDELAGVMGHEMGHVICHHTITAMIRNVGLGGMVAVVGAIMGDMDKVAALVSAAQALDSYRFSRTQESEADMVGVRLSMDAGYDPHGLMQFFQRMEKINGPQNKVLNLISDHPLDSERVEAIQKEIERIKTLKSSQ